MKNNSTPSICSPPSHCSQKTADVSSSISRRPKGFRSKWTWNFRLMHAAQAGNINAQKLLADEKQLNSKGLIVDPIISKYWVKFLNNEHQDIPMVWSLSPVVPTYPTNRNL